MAFVFKVTKIDDTEVCRELAETVLYWCHKILGSPLEWGPMGPHIINIMGSPSGFWGPL